MNSRTLILALLAAVLVGGLGFLLTRERPLPAQTGPLSTGTTTPRPVQTDPKPSAQVSTRLRTTADAPPGPLTVLVMGPKGQSLPEARISVESDGDSYSAVGRGTFYDLAAGEWTVNVSAEGFPSYAETVTLESGQAASRVIARLDDKALFNGFLVDQYGDLVPREPVWLLPEGAEHPARPQATDGAIRSQSGSDGRFRYRSITPGSYRLSIGKAGEKPRYQSEPFELIAGRERVARITLAATASLTVSAEGPYIDGRTVVQVMEQRPLAIDAGGPGDSAGFGGLDRGEELKRGLRQKRADAGAEGDDAVGLDGGDYGGQKDVDLTPEQVAQRKEAQERAQRAVERRGRLHEPGWFSVGSIQLEDGLASKLDDVPANTTLRLVVYRGPEGFRVADEFSVMPGARASLILNPPAPLAPGTELPVEPRMCASQKSIEPLPLDVPEVGIEWLED